MRSDSITSAGCPTASRPRPVRHGARGLLAIAAAVVALGAMPSTGLAASAPAWSLSGITYPTNFEAGSLGEIARGPGYTIVATNVGASPTSGEYTITDTLPPGLTPTGEAAARDWRAFELSISCETTGQTISCSGSEPIPPGQYLTLDVAIDVASNAVAPLSDQISVEGGGAAPAAASIPTQVEAGSPAFSLLTHASTFAAFLEDGSAATQAGAHPNQLEIATAFPIVSGTNTLEAAGHLRDFTVELPRGVVADPTVTPILCREAELEKNACPAATVVGTVAVMTVFNSSGTGPFVESAPLYNMVAPPGSPAEFAFNALGVGIYVHLRGGVRSDGEYQFSATSNDILARGQNPILGFQAFLWGDPSAESHDLVRGVCLIEGGACPVSRGTSAFLSSPSACSGPLSATLSADSWEAPGAFSTVGVPSTDGQGNPVGVRGCSLLDFGPTISLRPDTEAADSPSGLSVDLHVPQDNTYAGLTESNLKDAKVTLPPGMSVNPSSANGLAACSPAQIGMTTAIGQTPIRFTDAPASCPDASKLGTVEVDTPLLDHPLPGAIYLASPHQNPFGSLLAIYVAVYDPTTGVVIKLAGHIEADPTSGQLTATFDENPELPFEDFHLDFFGGPRAALKTPALCGNYDSRSEFAPWSGTAPVAGMDSFQISSGPSGGACATSPTQQPNAPSFEAGTLTPLAGSYSPFILRLRRGDGSQELRAINTKLPLGLVGRVAGIPYCSDAQIAAAANKSGTDEQASPSCPPASEVGKVTVGAGAGSQPYYVSGKAYLAGPYKRAPLSLAIVTPAVAGPYDLGTVVVRSALYVDPTTAQITVKSDPIPTILQGIPLDIRSISVEMNRPEFTLNPTSCEAMAVSGEAISTLGEVAPLNNRFQAGGCRRLDFAPKLALRVFGKTNRNAKPRFRAVLQTKPGEANIRRAQVNLPHSLFLEQGHIKTICTRVQFAEAGGHGEKCPKGSVYGHVRAFTPLLDKPLEGPVYLRSSSHELPDLVAALNGQIDIDLDAKVDSGKNEGLRNTFEVVPDAPVSKFILELRGGKKGLLVNSENLCSKRGKSRRAIVRFSGQNGKVAAFKPKVANSCGKKKPGPRKHRHHGKAG